MRKLCAVHTTYRAVYNSTSGLGTLLYTGQPAAVAGDAAKCYTALPGGVV